MKYLFRGYLVGTLLFCLAAAVVAQTTQPSFTQQVAPIAAAADAQIATANQATLLAQQQMAALQKLLDAALLQKLPAGVIPIPAGTDIAKMNPRLGGDYFALGAISITCPWQPPANFHLHGNRIGPGIPLTLNLPTGSTGIDCRWGSVNFELTGFAISCPSNCNIFEGGNNTQWRGCTVETSFQEGMIERSPYAKDCIVESITAKKAEGARLVLVVGADTSITRNNVAVGSLGEAVFRVIKGDDGHIARGVVLTGNTFGFANNPVSLQKPLIDLRVLDAAIVILNNEADWSRVGDAQDQDQSTTATNIFYGYNTHLLGVTGIPPVQLMGATIHVEKNTFYLNSTLPAIDLGGGSKLFSADGNIKISTDHKPMKPLGPGTSDGTNTVNRQ